MKPVMCIIQSQPTKVIKTDMWGNVLITGGVKGSTVAMHNTQSESGDRGVSPVIGVILMVAITVILAAVISTFVLDMANQTGRENANAGVSVQFDKQDDDVDVVFTSRPTDTTTVRVNVTVINDTAPDNDPNGTVLTQIGESHKFTEYNDGDTIRVTATALDGDAETVVLTRESTL